MIISDKRRDYYDCIQRSGQDRTCRYVRVEEDIEVDCSPPRPNFNRLWNSTLEPIHFAWIGFCGEIYPAIYMRERHEDDKPSQTWKFDPRSWHFNPDEVIAFMESHPKEFHSWRGGSYQAQRIREFFESSDPKLEAIFQSERCPVFVAHREPKPNHGWLYHCKVTLNPMLKDYEFQRIVDPYQAFQRIHAYLSGVLGREEMKMPEISDEMRAEIHGFNAESFRAPKGTRPNRKNKKKVG